jgi:hypothetical protein
MIIVFVVLVMVVVVPTAYGGGCDGSNFNR